MPDIASLGLQIDTSQIAEGKKALDQFADAGAKVEQGARSLNGQMNDTTKLMRAQAEASKLAEESKHKLIAALEREIAVAGMSRGELERYKAAEAGLGRAAQDRAMALGNTVDAMRREETEMRALAASQDRAAASAEAFIKRIQEQAATLGMGRSQLLAYQAAQLGVSKEAEASVAKIKAYEDAIKAATDAKAAAAKQSNLLADSLSLLAKGYAAFKVAEYIKDAALLAARYETLGVVTEVVGRNAGYTKAQMDTATTAIAAQGITMIESRESATKLVQAHVDLRYATQLARIAQDAAVIGHINSSEAFDRLVNGIARGNVLILRNIGINVNMESAYRQMGQTLGKTANDLTENERVQARLNAVLERGTDIAGTYAAAMDTAGKQLTSMQRYTQDLKTVIGETFNETLTIAVMAVTDGLKGANKEVSELSKNQQLHEWGKSLADVFVWVGNKIDNAVTAMRQAAALADHSFSRDGINAKYDAQVVAPEAQGAFLDVAGRNQRIQRINAARAAELAEENAAYTAEQAKLAGQYDRFEKSAAERQAAITARHKAEAEARLKVDQDYAAKATALLIANANKSVEIQQAAQAALAKSIYEGTPTYRDTDPRPPKAKVDKVESTELADRLARMQDVVNAQKAMYENLGKLDDAYHAAGKLGDEEYYQNQRARLVVAGQDQFDAYSNQILELKSYHNGTAAEAAKHAKQINDIEAKRQAAYNENQAAIELGDKKEILRKDAIASASEDAKNKYLSGLDQEAKKLEDANSARETSKAAVERETIARLDLAIAYQKQFIADQAASGASAEEIAQAPAILKYLEDVRAARARIASGLDQQQALQYKDKAAEQAIKDWQRAGQTISDSLTDAFGRAGKAAGQMYQAYAKGMADQLRAQKDLAAAKKLSDDNPEKVDAINRAQLNGTLAHVKSYADMTAAAQGFFSEGSKGYRAMHAASVVLHGAEVALSLVKGVNAVLTQGEGDPYTAFARMAAMAALVAGLGVAIGGVGGGGGASAKDRQAAAGTGSILGDSSAKSESIARAIALTAENSNIELSHTAAMAASLRSIDSSIAGLGNLLIRTTGLDGKVAPDKIGGAQALTESVLGNIPLIGGILGNTVGKIVGSIFGGKTTVDDTGVWVPGKMLGTVRDTGLDASKYVDTTKSGGWFSSDKHNTQITALGPEINAQFSQVIIGLADSVNQAASLLGVGGDAFLNNLNAFVVDIGTVSFKGLTGDEIQKQLETVFSKVGDDLARFGVDGLSQFQKVGEGYLETLTRVASNYANLDSILASSGTTFGQTGMASIAARERLIELTGGIDKLASQQSGFNDSFLTKAERLAPVQKYVTDQLAAMGLQSLDTRDKFKDYVLGLANGGALATESGAKQYAALMALSEAFAKTHAATVDLTKSEQEIADERIDLQNQLDQLTMTQEQLLGKARAAIDSRNQALYDEVQAAQVAQTRREMEIALMDAQGDKAGALAATRAAELAAMAPALRALQQQIYAQQDIASAAQEASTILSIQAQMYESTGNKAAVAAILEQQHQAALVGLSPALAEANKQLWAAQATQKLVAEATSEHNAVLTQLAALYSATGDKVAAAAVLEQQRQASLVGLTPAVVETTKAAWAAQDAEKARNDALTISNGILTNQAAMYEAMGDKAGAALVAQKQWEATLAAMDPALRESATAARAAQAAEKDRTAAVANRNAVLEKQASYYESTNNTLMSAYVLEQQRTASLAGQTQEVIYWTRAAWAAEDAEKARTKALTEANTLLDLQAQTYAATGNAAGAALVLEKQRANALIGLTPAIAAATQAMWAAQDAAEKKKRLDDLNLELLNAQGKSQEALNFQRRAELAALSATEQAIKQATYAAIDKAKTDSLKLELLSAQGQDAEVKRLQRLAELATLSAGDQEIKKAIYAAQDKAEADKAATEMAQQFAQAQQQAKSAAEELVKAWQSATDSIMDEVKRIRGLIDGSGAQSYAAAQSAFAIATGQARAGDQEAAKLLPSLSKAMLDLAEANAVTSFDLRLARAQAAASLSQTSGLLAGKFGLSVPSYDVGTDYVPQTGLALIHEGEKITPAAYNNPFTPPAAGSGMDGIVAELRALREDNRSLTEEVKLLRESNSRALYQIAKNGSETNDTLSAAANGNMPFVVEVVPA
nr:hypothetical protein [uncultured Duganella sp.]